MGAEKGYKKAVKEFSERVLKKLGKRLDSIILYGSLAAGNATKDSDIDVLIIVKEREKRAVESDVLDISYQVDYENRFETFIVPVFMTPKEVEKEIRSGSYFIKDVLEQGVVLYDDGTIRRIREETS
jgi:predicted nucleotidyltransferase